MKQFTRAARNRCKIKMAIQGPSGSGKTYSALLLAYGLTNDWGKIAVIDTENGSANLYANLGGYSVLTLSAPFTPEAYSEAVDLAVKSGFECLIIDSLSAEWNGQGGILDIHGNIPGNSFTAWAKVTPRHNAFVQKLLQSEIHVIGTMRSKTEYVLSEKNGKQVPEKVGMKAVQREDSDYEFTLVFELNHKHEATVSKNRTGLFEGKSKLNLSVEVGQEIIRWCRPQVEKKESDTILNDFEQRVGKCCSIAELISLFNENPTEQIKHRESFIKRRNQISVKPENFLSNGVHH